MNDLDPNLAQEKLVDLAARAQRQRKRHYARSPKPVANVLAQLFNRNGYGTPQGNDNLAKAWADAAGAALAKQSHPTKVRRGVLEVVVGSSMMMQELGFDRQRLLRAMQAAMPDARIEDLRFKVGRLN